MAKNVNDIINHLDKLAKMTSNKMAERAQEIFIQHIMDDVYEYYDEIRGGYDSTYPSRHYHRTYELLNAPKIRRSRGKAFIWFDYDHDILDRIRSGKTDWENSVLYSLSDSARKRDFYAKAKKEINASLDNFAMREFERYGLKLKRRKR